MKYEDVKNQMEFDKFEEMAYAKHDKLIDTFLQDIDKLSKKTRNNHKWNLDAFSTSILLDAWAWISKMPMTTAYTSSSRIPSSTRYLD